AVPHATGQHYAIGAPGGIRSFEGWAGGIAETTPSGRHVLHTNHPLGGQSAGVDADAVYARSRTRERLACLASQTETLTDRAGLEAALADTSVPISIAPRAGFMTFGGVSLALTAPPEVRIAPGPPHMTPFEGVAFPTGRSAVAD
ncbi:MAG TPA: hypothetical protein VFU81_11550, partial [Thermomicrobiales bacterium]|nr:hypothetical protein [Thermomicrobiales bacterium]